MLGAVLLAALGVACLISIPRAIRRGRVDAAQTDARDQTSWIEISRKTHPVGYWTEIALRVLIGVGSIAVLVYRLAC